MIPSNLAKFDVRHLRYLSERMRADEIEQFLAFTGYESYTPQALVDEVECMQGPKFTILRSDGYPAACGGYFYVDDGVWQSWMAGSMDGWGSNWRSLTKGARWLMDALFMAGAKRLQTYVLASRTRAMEWYARGLKMECDRILPGYANGRDAALFVRGA